MRSISLMALLLAAFFAACSGGEQDVTQTSGGPSASGTPEDSSSSSSAEQFNPSPRSLPTRPVEFTVALPEGTSAPVRVRVIGLHAFETVREVQLRPVDSTTWTATLDLEEGALIRYRYERTDERDLESLVNLAEAQHADLDISWRLLAVTDDLSEVHDTVAMWADQRHAGRSGTLTGILTESGDGAPLHNVEVSVGGMHTATGIHGEFVLPELAPGQHTLTMHRADGSVFARSMPVTVTADAETTIEIELTAAAPVQVTFRVAMPADSPDGAHASLFGTAQQLGGWFYQAPNQNESLTQPVVGPAQGEVAYSVELFEGQHVLYRYNLGMVSVNGERSTTGEVFRQFVVSARETQRRDLIETWRLGSATFTTVRVQVPDNTPAGPPPSSSWGPHTRSRRETTEAISSHSSAGRETSGTSATGTAASCTTPNRRLAPSFWATPIPWLST